MELWELLRNIVLIAVWTLVALAIVGTAAYLLAPSLRKLRPTKPPPPPRPPWEVAREELFDIRHQQLVEVGRHDEHFERVADTIRKYLGARFDFDGLESTTREIVSLLESIEPRPRPMEEISRFLREADLVKFARTSPSSEQCEEASHLAERIIDGTVPLLRPESNEPAKAGPSSKPGGST